MISDIGSEVPMSLFTDVLGSSTAISLPREAPLLAFIETPTRERAWTASISRFSRTHRTRTSTA